LLGVELRGGDLPDQDIKWATAVGAGLYYNAAYCLIGIVVAFLFRNIAIAIVSILIIPSTIEPLLGLLLKGNAVYLPFTALQRVAVADGSQALGRGEITIEKALAVSLAYLVIGLLATWLLFLKRDAN
jgi:hypothetical protein